MDPECVYLKPTDQIPCYAPDGTSLGVRPRDAAERLISDGHVTPSYGRKGHLRAIWLLHEDGTSPVATRAVSGTRYSFMQRLDDGSRCLNHRRVDGRDEKGVAFATRADFGNVVNECTVSRRLNLSWGRGEEAHCIGF
jgi:hypothetical protein